ncbi:MAG: LytR C-terminal domain-containing protein [Acidimicrobiales bacterium]|nr:LytR C-terminal domain-containing protein [Acidimicrobiales bacterium]
MTAPRGGIGPSNAAAAPRALLLIVVAVLLGAALLWKGLDDGTAPAGQDASPTTTVASDDGSGDAASGDGSGDAASGDGSGSDGSGDAASGDGSGDDGSGDDGSGDGTAGSGDGTTTTSTLFPTVTEPPSEVQVLVANGSGIPRGAGTVTELLVPKGYATLPPANAQPTEATMIYFRPGMVNEARAVMEILAPDSPDLLAQIPPTGVAVAENAVDRLEAADIVVILGADERIYSG